jgi:hypothetical protein
LQTRVCPDIVECCLMCLLNLWLNECRFLAVNYTCHVTLKIEHAGGQVFDSVRVHKALCKDTVRSLRITRGDRTHDNRLARIKPL